MAAELPSHSSGRAALLPIPRTRTGWPTLEGVISASEDTDRILVATLTAPPPLEQARESLEYWTRRRASLPVYKRAARREADEMMRRCRERVAEAERRRYGTGLMGLVRRVLAGDGPSWNAVRLSATALAWMFLPRRLLMVATAFLLAWLLVAVLVVAALFQFVT